MGLMLEKSQQCKAARSILVEPSLKETPTDCGLPVALNRLPRARQGQHLTLAYTSFRKHQSYPEGEPSRQALNSAETNSTSLFSTIYIIFSFTHLFNIFLFLQICSYFSLFFISNLILLSPFLIPFLSSVPFLLFIFFPFFKPLWQFLVSILTLTISPISSSHNYFSLLTSYSFFLFLIIFLFSFHIY